MRTYIGNELQYQLIDNLNSTKAPNNHATSQTTYGIGTASQYGHCKVINNLTTGNAADGQALNAYQGKILNDKVTAANNNANGRLSSNGGTINGDLTINEDLSVNGNTNLYGNVSIGSTYINENTGNVTIGNNLYADNGAIRSLYTYVWETVTNASNLYITSNGNIRRSTNTSSKRYKKDIKELCDEELKSERLYDLKVKQFKYKKEYQPNEKDTRYNKNLVGLIAEDVAEVYPIAADFNEVGQVENWNERYLIPAMLDLIQKQNKRIKTLEDKLVLNNE